MAFKKVGVLTVLLPIGDFDKIDEDNDLGFRIKEIIGFQITEGEGISNPVKLHDLREDAERHFSSLKEAAPHRTLRLWVWASVEETRPS